MRSDRCLALAFVALFSTAIADEQTAGRPADNYTHLLYERIVDAEINGRKRQDRQIALQALPVGKDTDAVEPARRIQSWNGRVIAVRNGLIFANGGIAEMHVLNLETGQHVESLGGPIESFQLTSRPGEFIGAGPYGFPIYRCSFETGKRTILVKGPGQRPAMMGRAQNRIVAAPNGKRLAIASYKSGDISPVFEVHVVDLSIDPPKGQTLEQEFCAELVLTGGSDHAVAPPIFWADDTTLLVAGSNKKNSVLVGGVVEVNGETDVSDIIEFKQQGLTVVQGGEVMTATHKLHQINVLTGLAVEVCDLKLAVTMSSDPFGMGFWRRSDGAIMLRANATWDTRIDLKNKTAIRERKLSPRYEFKGDPYRPSLWHGDHQLTEKIFYRNVSVSPDGRCIAWLTPVNPANPNAFSSASSFPHALLYYSDETGVVELAQGRFQNGNHWGRFANPVTNPPFHWLTANDFEASEEFE